MIWDQLSNILQFQIIIRKHLISSLMQSQLFCGMHCTPRPMRNLSFFFLIILASSCTVQKVSKSIKKSDVFANGFIGCMIVDPAKDKILYAQNESRHFIPASNTKLFTFYTSYKALGTGKANGLNYLVYGDSLVFWGSGDPSLLHPDLKDTTVIDFLKNSPQQLYLVDDFEQVTAFGPGWSWNWYTYYFATERSVFPIYGNIVRFEKEKNNPEWSLYPTRFKNVLTEDFSIANGSYHFERDHRSNTYKYAIQSTDSLLSFATDKPFITSAAFTAELLAEAVGKPVTVIPYTKDQQQPHQKLMTAPLDSIYAQMLKISDNFLAEQLLLMVSDQLFDSLHTGAAIQFAKENYLQDLPDEPQWVDGSGLSAQNMFTPRSIISLLKKIQAEVPMEKIKAYFPAGGESGTIRNYYKSDPGEPPYVYAKTGTLSMSNALSGYLFTKSGKILLFSFLLNNYTLPGNDLKKEMEKVLYALHDRY